MHKSEHDKSMNSEEGENPRETFKLRMRAGVQDVNCSHESQLSEVQKNQSLDSAEEILSPMKFSLFDPLFVQKLKET